MSLWGVWCYRGLHCRGSSQSLIHPTRSNCVSLLFLTPLTASGCFFQSPYRGVFVEVHLSCVLCVMSWCGDCKNNVTSLFCHEATWIIFNVAPLASSALLEWVLKMKSAQQASKPSISLVGSREDCESNRRAPVIAQAKSLVAYWGRRSCEGQLYHASSPDPPLLCNGGSNRQPCGCVELKSWCGMWRSRVACCVWLELTRGTRPPEGGNLVNLLAHLWWNKYDCMGAVAVLDGS
jgi:hypothetical protein